MQARAWIASVVLAACAREPKLLPDAAGGLRANFPEWKERHVEADPAGGFLEHVHAKGSAEGRVQLAWEVDERPGAPRAGEALAFAGLGEGASITSEARVDESGRIPKGASEAGSHAATRLRSERGQALVWRCDRSGRIVRFLVEGARAPPLDVLAPAVRCHTLGERPVNGDVPGVSVNSLGQEWRLARRKHGSAVWLSPNGLLVIFAGQLTRPARDLVEAGRLVPGWARVAGLAKVEVKEGARSTGPQQHPGTRIDGTAELDGEAVRFAFLEWRCVARGRTYRALVAARTAKAPPGGSDWTGFDSALGSVRCHGGQ